MKQHPQHLSQPPQEIPPPRLRHLMHLVQVLRLAQHPGNPLFRRFALVESIHQHVGVDETQSLLSGRLMNELMEEDRLRVSTQVLQELFVSLTRKVSRRCSSEEALAVLEDLSA
jgi:hypothetical protein